MYVCIYVYIYIYIYIYCTDPWRRGTAGGRFAYRCYRCLQNKRPKLVWDHNVCFAPVPTKLKVEKTAPSLFYVIGRLFCTPIHSKSYIVNIDLWGEGG